MADNSVDLILARLRVAIAEYYPERGVCRAVRLVGHTPKPDHYTYEAIAEFTQGQERISCKLYRGKNGKETPKSLAAREYSNLSQAYEATSKVRLGGVPRPLGDYSDMGAVVSEKVPGVPLQSVIMRAALLPGYANSQALKLSAGMAGRWLREFHLATQQGLVPVEPTKLLLDLEKVCSQCKSEGLEPKDIHLILNGAKQMLAKAKRSVHASAAINGYTPLNLSIAGDTLYICDLSKMLPHALPLIDVALFMAAVEALEKYPFCNREITAELQEVFLRSYGINPAERAIVRVLKMQTLLAMFAAGRDVKQTAVRKKVMWANVMKKFIQEAAARTLSNAA